jgi:peptide-methionine (R)-S-oxide reductase
MAAMLALSHTGLAIAKPAFTSLAASQRSLRAATAAVSLRAPLRRGVAMASAGEPVTKVQKSEDEWRAILNPEQFRILRQKGTE